MYTPGHAPCAPSLSQARLQSDPRILGFQILLESSAFSVRVAQDILACHWPFGLLELIKDKVSSLRSHYPRSSVWCRHSHKRCARSIGFSLLLERRLGDDYTVASVECLIQNPCANNRKATRWRRKTKLTINRHCSVFVPPSYISARQGSVPGPDLFSKFIFEISKK